MTDEQRAAAKVRLNEFKRKCPGTMNDLRSLPAVIIGANGEEMELLDATLADFRYYMGFLERSIRRRERASR